MYQESIARQREILSEAADFDESFFGRENRRLRWKVHKVSPR